MKKIDILLPIYNSYLETKGCIESILKHTNPNDFHLFLLDDKSPDDQIQELTSYYASKYDNISAIRNESNLGFPANVNNGFRISSNDVIVINSDTLVSENWLSVLRKVAEANDSVAAVNPMSNYGIISGLPVTNSEINDLFTYEELLNSFEKNKQDGYVETPQLIGFCMYMKRKALDDVGVFDAETFKRGYGEEADWCMRARKQGWRLVIAKGAYVHHIGGVSFGKEKVELVNRSQQILLQRYPEFENDVKNFLAHNHFKLLRKNMMKDLNFISKKTDVRLKLRMIKHFVKNVL